MVKAIKNNEKEHSKTNLIISISLSFVINFMAINLNIYIKLFLRGSFNIFFCFIFSVTECTQYLTFYVWLGLQCLHTWAM